MLTSGQSSEGLALLASDVCGTMNLTSLSTDHINGHMRPPATQLRDELLVMAAQDGEAAAMDELVIRWQKRLWRHAFRLIGRREAAWDVLQEGWLAIIRGLRRLDDPARFRPWAYRIVTHKAADWIRRHRRDQAVRNGLDDLPPPIGDDGREQTRRDDDADIVRSALIKISAAQRIVLILHYIDDLPVAEIAEVLNIPVGTVKSRLHNGRAELKRLLEIRD